MRLKNIVMKKFDFINKWPFHVAVIVFSIVCASSLCTTRVLRSVAVRKT